MKCIRRMLLALSIVVVSSFVGKAYGSSKIINLRTPGNLASSNNVSCVTPSKLSNKFTPVDLYQGVTACLSKGNFKDGAFIYALAGVYGRYDTLRVTDKSSHQALTVLKLNAFGSVDKAKLASLDSEVKKIGSNPKELRVACEEIKKIGAPNYFPQYMIQHGMKAFTGGASNKGLVDNFDSNAAWNTALDKYLHCPKN